MFRRLDRYPDGSDIRCGLYRGPGRSAAATMYVYVYVDEMEKPLGNIEDTLARLALSDTSSSMQ